MTNNTTKQPWWTETVDGVGIDDPDTLTARIHGPTGTEIAITDYQGAEPDDGPAIVVTVPERRYTLDELRALQTAVADAIRAAEQATAGDRGRYGRRGEAADDEATCTCGGGCR